MIMSFLKKLRCLRWRKRHKWAMDITKMDHYLVLTDHQQTLNDLLADQTVMQYESMWMVNQYCLQTAIIGPETIWADLDKRFKPRLLIIVLDQQTVLATKRHPTLAYQVTRLIDLAQQKCRRQFAVKVCIVNQTLALSFQRLESMHIDALFKKLLLTDQYSYLQCHQVQQLCHHYLALSHQWQIDQISLVTCADLDWLTNNDDLSQQLTKTGVTQHWSSKLLLISLFVLFSFVMLHPYQQTLQIHQSLKTFELMQTNVVLEQYRQLQTLKNRKTSLLLAESIVINAVQRWLQKHVLQQLLQHGQWQLERRLVDAHHRWSTKQSMDVRGDYLAQLLLYLKLRQLNRIEVNDVQQLLALSEQQRELDPLPIHQLLITTANSQSRLDMGLIQQAVNDLGALTDAINVYALIRFNSLQAHPTLRVNDLIADPNSLLTNRQTISLIYTRQGWQSVIKPQLLQWLQTVKQIQSLSVNQHQHSSTDYYPILQRYYLNDALLAWQTFLLGIKGRTMTQAAEVEFAFAELIAEKGPWRSLWQSVQQHYSTLLHTITDQSALSWQHQTIQRMLKTADMALSDRYRQALQRLHQTLQQGGFDLAAAKSNVSQQTYPDRLLFPWYWLINNLEHQQWQQVNQQWQSSLQPAIQQQVLTKFPFNLAGQDLSLTVFDRFFHPQQGRVSQWFDQHLLSLNTPEFLQLWMKLRGWFYVDNRWQLSFSLYPIPSPELQSLEVEVNQQLFRYRNGPQQWQQFVWQVEQGTPTVVLRAKFAKQFLQCEQQWSGAWAWWRFLKQAKMTVENTHQLHLHWTLPANDGQQVCHVQFKLRSEQAIAEIITFLRGPFDLPQSLIDGPDTDTFNRGTV